ncbi:MAG: hypothetical protein OEW42_04140 [Acidimicrobiia bacterium]|nr:hypothetical protein [Acidimicrobiia bacterium]MDH5237426.1 hypothetical protein [Acidimicrobiia bacterium]
MSTNRFPGVAAAVLALAVVVSACGSDAGDETAADGSGTSEAPLATSILGAGDPVALPVVDDYIGLTAAEAEAKAEEDGVPYRVGREDDERFPLTADFIEHRITVDIDDGVVTAASLG